METLDFLRSVITTEEGWFCLGYAEFQDSDKVNWTEEFFEWPKQQSNILARINQLSQHTKQFDLYFSPYLFSQASSQKQYVLPTRTIVADLDEANVLTLLIRPTILVETSKDRHQGYWILEDQLSLEEHEQFSKRLTYSIPRCDHSGWFLGKKVRIPNTNNNKYKGGPQFVRVVQSNNVKHHSTVLDNLPTIEALLGEFVKAFNEDDTTWTTAALNIDIGPQQLLSSIRGIIPARVVAQYNIRADDRSVALWALMLSAFRAGLKREQVFYLAYHSVNNKFKDLRYGGIRELGKDVLRAELEVNVRIPDVKAKIKQARALPGEDYQRNAYIADQVRNHLISIGTFIHTDYDEAWYIRHDTGRPIRLAHRATHLETLLDTMFGLNSSETVTKYVIHSLLSYTNDLPTMGHTATLSYYDPHSKMLLLHTGRKNIIKVTPDTVERVDNGYDSIIFPWHITNNVINPKYSALPNSWADQLFEGCMDNIIDIEPHHAQALLRIWFLSLLLRDAMVSRPILALFGQPGCLSGATKLQLRRGEHSAREYTLAEAANNTRWDSTIPTRILSVKDDVVSWRTIKQFIVSGKKETYTVKVNGQDIFRVTKDHRFLTKNGYKRLEDLNVGDYVIVKGDNLEGLGRSAPYREEVSAKYHPHARIRMVGKHSPYGNIYKYRAVYEAEINGLTLQQFCWIVNKNPEKASTLTYLPKDVIIHHKDENPYNNDFSNLEIMKKLDHDTHHGTKNVRNFGIYSGMWDTRESKIESIDYYGIEETYDIEMEDTEAPNFLVNNVVVHNSGKSTLMRRVYALLYGRERSIGAVTSEDNFDMSVSTDPLVVLDNVDSFTRWLPDRLALSASSSEVIKRKLYTDGDVVVLRRQAMIAITAHNPKFGREDVTDRLLLINFERLQHFRPETDIIDKIISLRDALWGDILTDIQKVLNTPMPTNGWEQFRIEDFARFGYWIAKAIGIADDFNAGIVSIRKEQKILALSEDEDLILCISRLLERETKSTVARSEDGVYYSPGQLWSKLQPYSSDPNEFKNRYRNAVTLGKKLWTLQDALREVYNVEWKRDSHKGSRVWRFSYKVKPVKVNTNANAMTMELEHAGA